MLQDLVNELGRRLEYDVSNGHYQGTPTKIGFDGIWRSPEEHTIVAEVKTTDAYRIALDKLAEYRQKLLAQHKISEPCSILILVGRQDTGELEAQIRGSRHAWDIRLISVDALLKLVLLKENSDQPETGRQIRSILTPMEYTRLDNMIDVMFATATDVETVIAETNPTPEEPSQPKEDASSGSGWQFTDIAVLDAKRAEIIEAVAKKIGTKLIKKSRALFWDAEHKRRVGCTISKRYTQVTYPYWYAFHPEWNEFLQGGTELYLVLGCMDLDFAFAIPFAVINSNLEALHTTTTPKKTYWHIHLVETANGGHAILLPHRSTQLSVDQYKIQIK